MIVIEEKRKGKCYYAVQIIKKLLFDASFTLTTGTGILLLLQVRTDTVVLSRMAILFRLESVSKMVIYVSDNLE